MQVCKTKVEGQAVLRKLKEEGEVWLTFSMHGQNQRGRFIPAEKIYSTEVNPDTSICGLPIILTVMNQRLRVMEESDNGCAEDGGKQFYPKEVFAYLVETHKR